MELGFIGLGHMGQPMARNLLKAGHRVIVYNRTRSKAEALAADGAEIADRPSETCRGEAVITMLADDAAVERVIGSEVGGCFDASPVIGRGVMRMPVTSASTAELVL